MKTNEQLAQSVRRIMDAELSGAHGADVELVEACVDAVFELDGIEPETEDEVRAGVEGVLTMQSSRRHRRVVRRAVIAAVAALLIVAVSVTLTPLGGGEESLMQKWASFLSQQEPGYRMEFGDSITLIENGKAEQYKTVRRFVRQTNPDILVPTVLPDTVEIRSVNVFYDQVFGCPSVHFITHDPLVSVSAYIGYTFDDLDTFERTERIGGFDCGVAVSDGWFQCNFNYGGNGYTVSAHSYADMVSIVENLQNGQELYGKGK